jgi:methylated-DNA-[protein]-cysteine S-methyltransferase
VNTLTIPDYHYLNTPIGLLEIAACDRYIRQVTFVENEQHPVTTTLLLQKAAAQFQMYFSGAQIPFDLPLAPVGSTFQQKVWQGVLQVPYGTTASYRDVASAIEQPTAIRAVGMAAGRNPFAIVIPCHRIIGHSGALTGYAWGIEKKSWLLEWERTHIATAKLTEDFPIP